MMSVDFLSVTDAAARFDVSVDTIRRWEKKGLIKSRRDSRNRRLFHPEEVERLLGKLNGSAEGSDYQVLTSCPSTHTSLDLFAGAGGTALGLSNAGFRHILLNEVDKHAVATLRRNRPDWHVVQGDVHDLDFHDYTAKVDLLEGGFPCQAFSYAGNKRGFADTRGTLFHEFARAVSEVQPPVAVGENVRGLVKHDHGRTLNTMLHSLQTLGYRVAYRVLRAQYHDVPQKRERLIMIAVRGDLDYPILFPEEKNYTVSLREAIADVPEGEGASYAPWKYEIMAKIPEGGYWRDLPDADQRSYMKASYFHTGGRTGMARRLAWDEPSLTLTCNPTQKQTERCHPSQTRPLNVREYARIQTFPDNWTFSGGMTQAYKQIGNAVPVNLAFHIGMGVRAMLDGDMPDGYEVQEPAAPIHRGQIAETTDLIR